MVSFFKDSQDHEFGIIPSCDHCNKENLPGVGMYAWQRSKSMYALVLCMCDKCFTHDTGEG